MAGKDFIMVPETLLSDSKTRPPLRPMTTKEEGEKGLEKS